LATKVSEGSQSSHDRLPDGIVKVCASRTQLLFRVDHARLSVDQHTLLIHDIQKPELAQIVGQLHDPRTRLVLFQYPALQDVEALAGGLISAKREQHVTTDACLQTLALATGLRAPRSRLGE